MLKLIKKIIKELKKDEGWSFLETIIVLGIVAVLSGGVAISAIKQLDKASITAANSQIGDFKLALEIYRQDCKNYPTPEQGLKALWEKPILSPVPNGWNGPYIDKELPLDPWDNEYIYSVPGENGLPFTISSLGADGSPGGEGKDSDIYSHK